MKQKTKYLVFALIAIVFIILMFVMYRIYFMFNRAKIEAYATEQANLTASPNIAFQLIKEGCEHILKSQDLTKQVKLLAQIDGIELEEALVLTALNNCYASGFIASPAIVAST